MPEALIGLGANLPVRQAGLSDREANLRAALQGIARESQIVAISSLYETEAVTADGSPGPPYLNAACRIETHLDALALFRFLKSLEVELGRVPSRERWAPRVIDLDLLLYGTQIIETDGLTVPHPRMHERPFVLVPLAEIAPAAVHPLLDRTVADLAHEVGDAGVRKVADAGWESRG